MDHSAVKVKPCLCIVFVWVCESNVVEYILCDEKLQNFPNCLKFRCVDRGFQAANEKSFIDNWSWCRKASASLYLGVMFSKSIDVAGIFWWWWWCIVFYGRYSSDRLLSALGFFETGASGQGGCRTGAPGAHSLEKGPFCYRSGVPACSRGPHLVWLVLVGAPNNSKEHILLQEASYVS